MFLIHSITTIDYISLAQLDYHTLVDIFSWGKLDIAHEKRD
ncbi:hypothetical protein [Colwellia maritima]|nr:hypothetical protein [Colwellia maritima]